MTSPNEILAAREQRLQQTVQLAKEHNVVCVKANIPGKDKRTPSSYALVRYFARQCDYGQWDKRFNDGADGCYITLLADGDALKLKQRVAQTEENHPLGRFVDIDVWQRGESKSLSRGYMRRCFLCDKPAFVCGRQGGHPTEELLEFIDCKTEEFFRRTVKDACIKALEAELNLHPKFGLVTPLTCGSHPDMNYSMMKAAHGCVADGVAQMFVDGLYGRGNVYRTGIPVGVETEKNMLEVTGGRNAYKGFIFVAGLLAAAFGRSLMTTRGTSAMWDIVRRDTADIEMGKTDSFGDMAYRRYGIGGVKEHARNGFPFVKHVAENVTDDSRSMLKQLVYCAGNMDDTVMLKRAGDMRSFRLLQQKFGTLDTTDGKAVDALDKECIDKGISLGGSADVLASGIFVKILMQQFASV